MMNTTSHTSSHSDNATSAIYTNPSSNSDNNNSNNSLGSIVANVGGIPGPTSSQPNQQQQQYNPAVQNHQQQPQHQFVFQQQQQQQQQQQGAQHNQLQHGLSQPVQTGAPGSSSGILYDISSFDPLQAHAFQLSASAGLTASLFGGQGNSFPQGTQLQLQQQQQPQQHQQQRNDGTNIIPQATAGGLNGQAIAHLLVPQQQPQQQQPQVSLPVPPGPGLSHGEANTMATTATTLMGPNGNQFLLLQPQQQQAATPAASAPSSSSLSGGVNTLQSFLTGGGGSAHNIVLPASLATAVGAGGFSPQLFPPNLFPQQFNAPQQEQQQQPSQQPNIFPATSSNKRARQETDNAINKKQRGTSSSVISSSSNGTTTLNASGTGTGSIAAPSTALSTAPSTTSAPVGGPDPVPPKEASKAELAKMTPAERRRYERNLREQQRSYRISQQIKELRDVLAESNVPFKPNKYSILLSVVDYIKQLQSRAIMLDTEHQKLITTLRQTNDTINSGNAPSSVGEESDAFNAASTSESGSESDMIFFVKGIDYRSVFEQCTAALGIAALDGRILECNKEFQTLMGFPRQEDLLKQSLFNLVRNHQDIFRAMAHMLKSAEEPAAAVGTITSSIQIQESENKMDNPIPTSRSLTSSLDDTDIPNDRYWTGPVTSKLGAKLLMNITLTLGDNGNPKFFSCALTNVTSENAY